MTRARRLLSGPARRRRFGSGRSSANVARVAPGASGRGKARAGQARAASGPESCVWAGIARCSLPLDRLRSGPHVSSGSEVVLAAAWPGSGRAEQGCWESLTRTIAPRPATPSDPAQVTASGSP